MSDSNSFGGFSFQLSESAPPVEAKEQTPLGDLDLDLNAFKSPSKPPPPSERADSIKPKIKKIKFPVNARPEKKTGPQTISRTQFSHSIEGDRAPRSFDSEPDIDDDRTSASEHEKGSLALPEDLFQPDALADAPATSPPSEWASETPSAREIWLKARKTWQSTSRHALALGGEGLRKGLSLADSMSERVKQRMLKAEEDRAILASSAENQAARLADDPASAPQKPSAALVGGSAASQRILGLAKSAGRKMAAPASALVVCGLVYLGGTYLLGADPAVLLSKSAATDLPDLGHLPEGDRSDPSRVKKEAQASPKSPSEDSRKTPEPQEMQTEVTEMPQGLSWPSKGLIEVVTSEEELIYVDGVFTGRGPLRRIPVAPGDHEVSIRADGKERSGTVAVQLNKNTRAIFKSE